MVWYNPLRAVWPYNTKRWTYYVLTWDDSTLLLLLSLSEYSLLPGVTPSHSAPHNPPGAPHGTLHCISAPTLQTGVVLLVSEGVPITSQVHNISGWLTTLSVEGEGIPIPSEIYNIYLVPSINLQRDIIYLRGGGEEIIERVLHPVGPPRSSPQRGK
jgi:hypothetical protein